MAEVKTDCFAYNATKARKCSALDALYCAKGEYKFYKSKNNGREHKKDE